MNYWSLSFTISFPKLNPGIPRHKVYFTLSLSRPKSVPTRILLHSQQEIWTCLDELRSKSCFPLVKLAQASTQQHIKAPFISWPRRCISLQGHRVIESPRSACIVYSWFLLDPCRQGAGKQFRAPLSSSHRCFIECHPSFSQEWNSMEFCFQACRGRWQCHCWLHLLQKQHCQPLASGFLSVIHAMRNQGFHG